MLINPATRNSLGLDEDDSPVFVNVKLSGLTDHIIPYNKSDTDGLADTTLYYEAGYLRPTTNDSVALGALGIAFSDLYLANGGTINWSNSDAVISHTTDGIEFTNEDYIFKLGLGDSVEIDAHTTLHEGAYPFNIYTQTEVNMEYGSARFSLSQKATTGRESVNIYAYTVDSTAKTSGDNYLRGILSSVWKYGEDTSTDYTQVMAIGADARLTGDILVGTRALYGVYSIAVGAANSTAYGIYALATSASTNWAGYFDGNVNVDGTFSGNVFVTGTFLQDALTAATAETTITLDGTGAGGVTIGGTSTGTVTLGGAATLVDLPANTDMTISGGDFTVTDTANADMVTFTNDTMTTADLLVLHAAGTRTSDNIIEITDGATTATTIGITANTQTSGNGISYTNSGAGLTGAAIYLAVTDGAGFTGSYINCYDGAASDFAIKRYGEVEIAGVAASDMLTISAGNVQVDNGKIEIDTTQNIGSYIKRNQATTTTPVFELEETDASGDNPVLLIDQNATSAASYGIQIASAGATGMNIDCEAVTGDGIVFTVPASYTGQLIKVSDTIVGTSGEGAVIDASTSANMATGSTLVRLNANTGTLAGATEGFILNISDTSVGVPTSYAVKIDSTSNEALHVATGKALFDEQATFTGGVDVDASLDIDFSANTEVFDLATAASDYAAGTGVATIYASAAGGATNATYLMRLAYKADGDAQEHFILCQDNSTGAAANGDEKFSVSTGGLTKCLGGVSPGAATDSILMTDTVSLSNANIKALRGSPKELVATPGAGKFLEFISAVLILDYGSEALTESADNMVIQYGTSGVDASAAIEATGFIDAGADTACFVTASDIAGTALSNVVNNSLVLFNTGDGEYAGNASNDTLMKVKITYRIHDDAV